MGRNKKPRNKKTVPKDEFRKIHDKAKAGHPTYIFAKKGKNFDYIGITHDKVTKGMLNIALDKNPSPEDKSKAHLRPYAEKSSQSNFGKTLKNWFFKTEADKKKGKPIIDDFKKKKGK